MKSKSLLLYTCLYINVFVVCKEGYFDEDGTCQMCNENSYKNQTGDQSCTDCPGNLVTESKGATSPSMCGKKMFISLLFAKPFLLNAALAYCVCNTLEAFLTKSFDIILFFLLYYLLYIAF